MRFLRKSWPIWAVWVGVTLFIVGLAINPVWTFVIICAGIMLFLLAMSIRISIDLAKEDEE